MKGNLRHGDAFAGIGGFGLAARRVGWSTVWACEIEPSARSIYAAQLGDCRFDNDIRESKGLPAIDILTGGFPCQDLSVAGKRRGLRNEDGSATRSGLFFELARILAESRPEWFVFENVPGLLSHDSGRTMGIVLSTLVECGYGVSWRILNAQFFGVAQRRRRVFIVGHRSGSSERPGAVLFESTRGTRNSAPGDEARADVADTLVGCSARGGRRTTDIQTYIVTHALTGEGHDASEDGTGRGTPLIVQQAISAKWSKGSSGPAGDEHHNLIVIQDVRGSTRHKKQHGIGIRDDGPCYLLGVVEQHAVAFSENQRGEIRTSDVAPALGIGGGKPGQGYPSAAVTSARVRTTSGLPRSLDVCAICEEGPDSPRYRGLGNAVAVPVIEWIFRRISSTESE